MLKTYGNDIVQTQTTSCPHTLSKDHYFGGGERFESIRRNWIYGSRSVCFVSYVKNNAFPQPLSSDDERKYLELMEQGDAQARNLLIEHNLRLVAHIVKNLKTQGRCRRFNFNWYNRAH